MRIEGASQPWFREVLVTSWLWSFIRVGGQNAHAQCPCLESSEVSPALSPFIEGDCLVPMASDGRSYCWSTTYGSAGCDTYDIQEEPDCADADGQPKPFFPQFCEDRWCYVDINSCPERYVTERPLESLHFPGSGLHYSYETCGSVQTFARLQQARTATAPELKIIIEDYAKGIRSRIEATFEQAQTAESAAMDCPGITHGCTCESCTVNSEWTAQANGVEQVIDFNRATLIAPIATFTDARDEGMRRDKCVSQPVEREIRAIARQEYNDPHRIAYVYYGSQSTGSLVQWPGASWCPVDSSAYDARFRPWYATAASGPKDIVVVFDKSGSMTQAGRMGKVKTGAKRVLDTLGEQDFATVVEFGSSALIFDEDVNLHQMFETTKDRMKTYIDSVYAMGGTNFASGIEYAAEALASGVETGRTSRCSLRIILFLTDGEDATFTAGHIRTGRLATQLEGVTFFTYSFGTGIGDQQNMKKVACMTGGVWTAVPDGGDIENAMARYYQVFAAGINAASARWVEYDDALSQTRLMAACYSVYDTRSAVRELYGVVCVDLSVIIDLQEFRDKPGYSDTWDEMVEAARSCPVVHISNEQLQGLRDISGSRCTACDEDPDRDCPVDVDGDDPSSGGVATHSAGVALLLLLVCVAAVAMW